jgi:hypothetical protein
MKCSQQTREIVDDFVNNSGTARQYAVMGETGSGKIFLLKTLKAFLISRNYCFLFTASTGIAATLLDGRTVHSAFAVCQKGYNYLSNLRITNRQGPQSPTSSFSSLTKYSCSMGGFST